ncbi:hypothetical protein [Streptomyces sp. NPDC057675]
MTTPGFWTSRTAAAIQDDLNSGGQVALAVADENLDKLPHLDRLLVRRR